MTLVFGLSNGQTITIQKTDNLPLFTYDEGPGRVQIDSYYYIHHFNLDHFKEHVHELKSKFEQIEANQFTSLILDKFNEIDMSLKNILPLNRRKRWDALGTFWKFLAGSPDAHDLALINSSINSLISNNNEQVRINREISFQMTEVISKANESINLFKSKSSELYAINIFLNLKFLNEKLDQISETIMLAKIGILNEKILSQDEISSLMQDLGKENITVWNIADALTYATTSMVTNEREIALLIKMPKLDPKVFRKILIIPTWFNRRQIHLHNKNYLQHESLYYMVHSLQPMIFDFNHIIQDESECVPKLLEGKPASCDYLSNPMENIIPIDNQHLVTNLLGNFTLRTNCGISERNLSGTHLITYSNCKVIINNQTFVNQIQNITGGLFHLPLYGVPIDQRQEVVNLSLEHLHNLHLQTRNEMEFIRLKNKSLQWPRWSIFGGLTATPFIIGIVLFLVFSFRRNPRVSIQMNQPTNT